MAEETYSFEQAKVRLEEIAAQVKKKDTSLEKSLDLLEEGVRLANLCTEQIDHTQWKAAAEQAAAQAPEPSAEDEPVAAEEPAADDQSEEQPAPEGPRVYDQAADEEPAAGECEPKPAGADAEGDIPGEEPPGGASEEPPAEDPDVEA